MFKSNEYKAVGSFPAPLEVDRELYNFPWSNGYDSGLLFPTPREVDKYLYTTYDNPFNPFDDCFRPLSR